MVQTNDWNFPYNIVCFFHIFHKISKVCALPDKNKGTEVHLHLMALEKMLVLCRKLSFEI